MAGGLSSGWVPMPAVAAAALSLALDNVALALVKRRGVIDPGGFPAREPPPEDDPGSPATRT